MQDHFIDKIPFTWVTDVHAKIHLMKNKVLTVKTLLHCVLLMFVFYLPFHPYRFGRWLEKTKNLFL